MEKLSLNKFKDKQVNNSLIGTIGGNGDPSFWDNLVDSLSSSEVVYPDRHTTGEGTGGCGVEHADGCHHHYVDNPNGTTQTYVGCGNSEDRCGVGNH